MRSSSTDGLSTSQATPAGTPDRPTRAQRPAAGFLPDTRTGWLRLAIVALLGLSAVLGPRLVGQTGAVYTDRSSVSGDIWTTPTFPPKVP